MLRDLLDWWPLFASIIGLVGVGGVLLLLGLWPAVTSFLIGTKIGRWITALGALALAIFWVFIAGKSKGARSERARQKARQMENIKKRVKSDEKISRMPPADRRRELDKWMRE